MTDMWSPGISRLGLLEPLPDENILDMFPYAVRRGMLAEIVPFLMSDPTSSVLLHSSAQVRWVMELLGQGFSFPMEEERLLAAVIEIYKRWALSPNRRPEGWKQQEQFFLQRVFMHSSALFTHRGAADSRGVHFELASAVLSLWSQVIRTYEKTLSLDTWNVLLKVAIGSLHHLFVDAYEHASEFVVRVSAPLIKVFFEMLLRCRMQDPTFWVTLTGLFTSWTHLLPVCVQWSAVFLAITRRAINILFGPSYGTDQVQLKWDAGEPTPLQLDDDFILYATRRLLNLVVTPTGAQATSKSFTVVMAGIESAVAEYLKANVRPAGRRALDGVFLLHIFGRQLFAAARHSQGGFEEGTGIALRTLCSIFSTLKETAFTPNYLAQFYDVLSLALSNNSGVVLETALLESSFLLLVDLEGCNLLLPSYLSAVRRVMGVRPSDSAGPSTEAVRAACIRLLGLMLPYPNHYETTELRHVLTAGPLAKVRSYYDLLPHLGASLLEALSTEPFGPNVQTLLNLCVTFHQLYAADDPRFFHLALSWIVNALLPSTWAREVQATMLRTLVFLAQLAPVKLEDKPRQVLGMLTRLLLQLVKGSGEMDAQLVQLTLGTICEWLLLDKAVTLAPTAQEAASQLLEALVLLFQKRDESPRVVTAGMEDVFESADRTLYTLLHHMGNFPSAAAGGADRLSSQVTEDSELSAIAKQMPGASRALAEQYMRCFATADGKTILSFIDQPFKFRDDGPVVVCIVRSKAGKHAWQFRFQPPKVPVSVIMQESRPPPKLPASPVAGGPPLKESELPDLMAFFMNQPRDAAFVAATQQMQAAVEAQLAKEAAATSRVLASLDGADMTLPPPVPADPYFWAGKVPYTRLLVCNLGLLFPTNVPKLLPIPVGEHLLGSLAALDELSEREVYEFGVVALSGAGRVLGQGSASSLKFYQFLLSLGWMADPKTHKGWRGSTEPNSQTPLVYFADSRKEVLFQASCHARPSSVGSEVQLVWVPDFASYEAAALFTHKSFQLTQLHLVVCPLRRGLYHVRLYRRVEGLLSLQDCSPVLHDSLLCRTSLGPLIRETAVHLQQALMRSARGGTLRSPIGVRGLALEQLVAANAVHKQPLDILFASLFTSDVRLDRPVFIKSGSNTSVSNSPLALSGGASPKDPRRGSAISPPREGVVRDSVAYVPMMPIDASPMAASPSPIPASMSGSNLSRSTVAGSGGRGTMALGRQRDVTAQQQQFMSDRPSRAPNRDVSDLAAQRAALSSSTNKLLSMPTAPDEESSNSPGGSALIAPTPVPASSASPAPQLPLPSVPPTSATAHPVAVHSPGRSWVAPVSSAEAVPRRGSFSSRGQTVSPRIEDGAAGTSPSERPALPGRSPLQGTSGAPSSPASSGSRRAAPTTAPPVPPK